MFIKRWEALRYSGNGATHSLGELEMGNAFAGTTGHAPANITVVNTAPELQQAMLNDAVDIEIRSHLDMRLLKRLNNPAIVGPTEDDASKKLALLYASTPLRSIRVCPYAFSPGSIDVSHT